MLLTSPAETSGLIGVQQGPGTGTGERKVCDSEGLKEPVIVQRGGGESPWGWRAKSEQSPASLGWSLIAVSGLEERFWVLR